MRGCSPALRMQQKCEPTLIEPFPLAGAGLGCQLCLCQGTAAKAASGGRGGYPGVLWPCWESVDARVPGSHSGHCPQPLSALWLRAVMLGSVCEQLW